jgi:hypothetical protein
VSSSNHPRNRLAGCIALAAAASAIALGQPATTLPVEQLLKDRLGIPASGVSRFEAGNTVVWPIDSAADNEVAAVGALRAKGDLRRIVAWLRDIESFMKAAGTENVGAIAEPAVAADFARINLIDEDFGDLEACQAGHCDVRMPSSYVTRFQKEVAWQAADAQQQAASLARTLLGEYVRAYQTGGDAGIAAFDDRAAAGQQGAEFQDLLRRSTKVWDLAYPFVSYLETFPKNAPPDVESRFYWTRDKAMRKPALTLHHVVLQQLPEGRVLVADKQFYASRDIDAALVLVLGVPNGTTAFDLVVSVKARADALSGVTGRVLRGRIEKQVRDGLAMYLDWIRGSAAL